MEIRFEERARIPTWMEDLRFFSLFQYYPPGMGVFRVFSPMKIMMAGRMGISLHVTYYGPFVGPNADRIARL